MIQESVAIRYARALLDLAKNKSQIDNYGLGLKNFLELCQKSKIFLPTLSNKKFSVVTRIKILESVLERENYNPDVLNFIKLLIKNGRIDLISLISDKYSLLADQQMARSQITISTAVELTNEQYAKIQACFDQELGLKTVLKKEIAPELLGGVQVKIGNRIYDNSIKKQLTELKEKCYANQGR